MDKLTKKYEGLIEELMTGKTKEIMEV